jgi:hypothetical protein
VPDLLAAAMDETEQSSEARSSLSHPWESGTLSGSRRECCNHAEAIAKQRGRRAKAHSFFPRNWGLRAERREVALREQRRSRGSGRARCPWMRRRRHGFRISRSDVIYRFNEPASAVSPWIRSVPRDTRQNLGVLGQSVVLHGARNRICCCAASLLCVLLFPLSALTLLPLGRKTAARSTRERPGDTAAAPERPQRSTRAVAPYSVTAEAVS